MALKDWEKREKDYWGNEETGEVVWIDKYNYREGKRYGVFQNPGILLKSFKSKSQALAYAKKYMRTH